MRVLVTGAAGSLGRVVTVGLVELGHDVVGLDLVPAPEGTTFTWHEADCSDADAVAAVFAEERLDAVVHLAGVPDEVSLPEELTSHVVTTAALLDAMVAYGVNRIVYASSNHAVGRTPRTVPEGAPSSGPSGGPLRVDTRPRPDTFYGVAKVAAEALLSLYVDRYGIDAVATRIGSFLPQPESRRGLSTWLSHDDAVRMFEACLTTPDPGFAVIYGISNNTRGWWDLEPGRALGYHPQDDAERFADQLADGEPTEEDRLEGSFVGGPFAGEQVHRTALDRRSPAEADG